MLAFLKQLLTLVATKLRHEPVAVWGVVIAAVLGFAPHLGVPKADVDVITTVLALAGIPVVRRKVTPMAALKALLAGRSRT